jgi:hypothetical protein
MILRQKILFFPNLGGWGRGCWEPVVPAPDLTMGICIKKLFLKNYKFLE